MSVAHCRERALLLPCEGEHLLAVLCEPDESAAADLGVVVIVGGPQYRAGSHRQFVHLARALAGAGFPVLRFDVRGMGDSTGALRGFEHLGADVRVAIDALFAARPGLRRVVLWGLCDGASSALLYLHERPDARVHGLCLLNPWVRSEASLARTHVKHYYRRRLMQREFWAKLLRGRVGGRMLSDAFKSLRLMTSASPANTAGQQPFQYRMAQAWSAFDGPLLLVLSGDDYTAREFNEFAQADPLWRANLAHPRLVRLSLEGADHTFSDLRDRQRVEAATLEWLNGDVPVGRSTTSVAPRGPAHLMEHA